MAHYAKIGLNNEVIGMSAVATRDCMTEGGIEREELGLAHLQKATGHQTWKKCSYNTKGGIHYNSETGEVSADQTKAITKMTFFTDQDQLTETEIPATLGL